MKTFRVPDYLKAKKTDHLMPIIGVSRISVNDSILKILDGHRASLIQGRKDCRMKLEAVQNLSIGF
jgi:hypothetical protein